jgi:transketolase
MAQLASIREAFGKALVELGYRNPGLVVLDADLSKSTQTARFGREFPERFFDCGVAEQNMMSIAAGLAAGGKTVFAATFAVFASGRAFDQVRLCIAQPGSNVKIVGTHGGISVGEDGMSHHAIEDISLMSSLPGMTVIVPADAVETRAAVFAAAEQPGPFYIRLNRPNIEVIYTNGLHFRVGRANELREGGHATVIACGSLVTRALKAAESLAEEGIECRVLDMATVKPLDREAVLRAAEETGAIVTAEEALLQGGLGAAVASLLAEERPTPMRMVAIRDVYNRSARPDELLELNGLTAPEIARAVRATVARKKG